MDYLKEYSHVTRKERYDEHEPIQCIDDLVIDRSCKIVCRACAAFVRNGKIPKNALANGLWLGEVPDVLKDLTWVERRLIAKVRINTYVVQMSSGHYKIKGNVIAFSNPIAKVYDQLPPPIDELDQVLAVVFVGPSEPTDEELKKSPLLVRRNAVARALKWLKLNHSDYESISISSETLSQYPENGVPFKWFFKEKKTNKGPENTSVDDHEDEEGVTEGECPFIVHGLLGNDIVRKGWDALTTLAVKHIKEGGKALAVGHSANPEPIFGNPSLYPQIFPWLFPYGMGGIKNNNMKKKLASKKQKAHLLMYHDKRFQVDKLFPIVAFNHEQIQATAKGGFLLTKKKNFPQVSSDILQIDSETLNNIITRLSEGEHVVPSTTDEKKCFSVLNNVDHVSNDMDGSLASKKRQRSELWSLMSYHGAPSWFITFAPADKRHPIALYYADTNTVYNPVPLTESEQYFRIAHNPVAGARFFHFFVNAFLKHVLGIGADHPGAFGDAHAYYGTVEQQGRLTLHLHMLLWIRNALSPAEIRERLLNKESVFQRELIDYLKSCHTGDYINTTHDDVKARADFVEKTGEFRNPLEILPDAPPVLLHALCNVCDSCTKYKKWLSDYYNSINHILFKVNYHTCHWDLCMNNKFKTCKARFPRDTHETSSVDPETGGVILEKHEPWLNTFTPLLIYLLRCNTDTTSLLSGTSIKAVIAYITDYISKSSLKTHVVFDTLRTVFDRSTEILEDDSSPAEKARKIITKLVNSLIGKLEIGAPMASMYLLGNPDHYTNQLFTSFYWKSFVDEVMDTGHEDEFTSKYKTDNSSVVLSSRPSRIVAISSVDDYTLRPQELSSFTLMKWVTKCKKVRGKKSKCVSPDYDIVTSDTESEDEPGVPQHDTSKNISSSVNKYFFLPSHPQKNSYSINVYNNDTFFVPNFVGPSLPRQDIGDREYYCATMLTLFKPWRIGTDLRTLNASWSTTFNETCFSAKDIKMMQNFNLRYECLDARDDFNAQRKKAPGLPFMEDYPQLKPGVTETDDDLHAIDYDRLLNMLTDGDSTWVGAQTQRKNIQMQNMKNTLLDVGWYNDGFYPLDITPTQLPPEQKNLNSDYWKKLLDATQKQILSDRQSKNELTKHSMCGKPYPFTPEADVVKIVDKQYFRRRFRDTFSDFTKIKNDLVKKFSLNKEQERAFRIVSNHVTALSKDQLQMYVGGMAGTGKSQVIKCITEFFSAIGKRYCLALLAPTGAAASLINGSTYHSFLGINERDKTSQKKFASLRAKTDRIEYIIMDEVSMLGLRDLYKISEQLANLKNITDVPYGAVNIIFAGDFAQLPPPMKSSALYASIAKRTANSLNDQHTCIGKALWHQVVTVVLLRQNMRQKTQTENDAKLRTCLQNMRFKACTTDDINYLKTRQILLNSPIFSDLRIRNVPIIAAWNSHRDQINTLGVLRFANDTQQTLHHFYSVDSLPQNSQAPRKKTNQKKTTLTNDVQHVLWNLPPAATEHVPGIISLCKDLPVMIKYNQATECCITNGAEAKVVDWISYTDPDTNKLCLQTVFVQLTCAPEIIVLPNLPPNVVPITPESKKINCTLPNDNNITITRVQIPLLPDFAMTDYASQGRTRQVNVTHLAHCQSHQSYYTCLSRSSKSETTFIVGRFNEDLVTGGLSGWLRQEFRELELLDQITSLRYEEKLPDHVSSHRRNVLIHQFRLLKTSHPIPKHVHPAISWSNDNFEVSNETNSISWKIVKKQKNINPERTTTESTQVITNEVRREGVPWLHGRNTCAYDALLTVLWNIFLDTPHLISDIDNNDIVHLTNLSFLEKKHQKITLNEIRERVRHALHAINDREFSLSGRNGVDLDELCEIFFGNIVPPHKIEYSCSACNTKTRAPTYRNPIHRLPFTSDLPNIEHQFHSTLNKESSKKCKQCHTALSKTFTFKDSPALLLIRRDNPENKFALQQHLTVPISPTRSQQSSCRLSLRGIIYHGDFHFTAAYVDPSGECWYHDGIQTKDECVPITVTTYDDLLSAHNRAAALFIYA